MRDPPRIERKSSFKEGGCSFCDQHVSASGSREHAVTSITGPGVRARFCDECAADFVTAWERARDERLVSEVMDS